MASGVRENVGFRRKPSSAEFHHRSPRGFEVVHHHVEVELLRVVRIGPPRRLMVWGRWNANPDECSFSATTTQS